MKFERYLNQEYSRVMKKLLLLLSLIFISINSYADRTMYCEETFSTGMSKINDIWQSTEFIKKRYTVNFSDDYSSVIIVNNSNNIKSTLDFPCNKFFIDDAVICTNTLGWSFRYQKGFQRFVYIHSTPVGWLQDDKQIEEAISVGTCNEF